VTADILKIDQLLDFGMRVNMMTAFHPRQVETIAFSESTSLREPKIIRRGLTVIRW
jgi:hypothetical protein